MKPPVFENTFRTLPPTFFSEQPPVRVSSPSMIRFNDALAELLGIDVGWLNSDAGVATLGGNTWPEGASPIATKYGGHQFGSWNPRLGDGRAVLLGELVGQDGERYDVQLKGSGPTPYSRGGDGRAPIGPVLREYIVSEAMFSLGVPTTRSLAAVATGDTVFRNVALPGAVLTRVAKSHIRVGTFEYFAAHESEEDLSALLTYTINRHFPEVADSENPALECLRLVVQAQASLIARWQALGFVHGVMNTDNMLVSGETIDYGPCAFIDGFSIDAVFSSIDSYGRYAYENQPVIAQWNLAQLARALILPVADRISAPTNKARRQSAIDQALEVVETFPSLFEEQLWLRFRKKLGLTTEEDEDKQLISDLLEWMHNTTADFTLTFRSLSDPDPTFEFPSSLSEWLGRWRDRAEREPNDARVASMDAVNPILIPRNHQVEAVIQAAERRGDFEPFHEMVDALSSPFVRDLKTLKFAAPPTPEEQVTETFCGT